MSQKPTRWLQRELQFKLLLPVLLIVVVGGILGLINANVMVEKTYDRWLLDAARSVAREVKFTGELASLELAPQAEAVLTYDLLDQVRFEVSQNGRHISGQSGLPLHGDNERSYRAGAKAFSTTFNGQPVRAAWVPVYGPAGTLVDVVVTETLNKRELTQGDLLWWYSPIGLLLVAAALVIVSVLRRTLRPLEQMAERWNQRSHVSLDPLPTHDVPRELLPFAHALNHLHARVRSVLDRERQYAATAAHQLRTPLTGLQLGLHRAAEAGDLASARAVIHGLSQSTERMGRLIQQLLALSRLDPEISAGMDFENLDLVLLASEVGEVYLDAATERGVTLELQAPAQGIVHVRGHRELLGEALGNLLDNAIRYTPRGGHVLLTVHLDPPALSVSDDGPGIPETFRKRLFDRFVRGDAADQAPLEGSGLGLAIVREIAQLHGAQVVFEDSRQGGATFTLRFAARR